MAYQRKRKWRQQRMVKKSVMAAMAARKRNRQWHGVASAGGNK